MIAISQRVDIINGERRDALDQRWFKFLRACKLTAITVPNSPDCIQDITDNIQLSGILLTGGNNLSTYGGHTPERDIVENILIDYAIEREIPVIGVCHGMQVIQNRFGVVLEKIPGHIQSSQIIEINGEEQNVNSYHEWGSFYTVPELGIWAKSVDGTIKAIQHRTLPILAMMWHPERLSPFSDRDISIFTKHFQAT